MFARLYIHVSRCLSSKMTICDIDLHSSSVRQSLLILPLLKRYISSHQQTHFYLNTISATKDVTPKSKRKDYTFFETLELPSRYLSKKQKQMHSSSILRFFMYHTFAKEMQRRFLRSKVHSLNVINLLIKPFFAEKTKTF